MKPVPLYGEMLHSKPFIRNSMYVTVIDFPKLISGRSLMSHFAKSGS